MENEQPTETEGSEQPSGSAELDPNDPDQAFAILEKNFNKVLGEMESDVYAAKYSDEFTKIFEALFIAHDKEMKLSERCQEVEYQLDSNLRKLESAIKLTETDQTVIDDLKEQIQRAWKMADAAHAREQTAQEIIENLRKQVETLNADIEMRNKFAAEQTEDSGGMGKKQENLRRERDRLKAEVKQLSQKLQNALGYQEELEHKNSAADLRINTLNTKVEEQTGEIDRVRRQKDKLTEEMTELNEKLALYEQQLVEYKDIVDKNMRNQERMEMHLRDEKNNYEKLNKEFESLLGKHTKLNEDFQANQYNLNQMKSQLNKKEAALKLNEENMSHMKNDMSKMTKMKDAAEKKISLMESEKYELLQDRTNLRSRIVDMEKDMDDMRRQGDNDKRTIDSLNREKEIINKSISRQQGLAQEQQKLIKIQEQQKRKLESELDTFYVENNKQKKNISHLERERDRIADEQIRLTKEIEELMDQIKLRKMQIFELKKAQSEQITKYRIQQNLFDIAKAERNSLQKQLQESHAEEGELRKKLKIVIQQTEQMKEDIAMKDSTLVKEENILRKAIKDKEYLKMELTNAMEQIKKLKDEIQMMSEEEKRLHQNLMSNKKLIREQAKDLEQLLNERDILGSQLVRRNDEVSLLHDKIGIFQSTLERGEVQYDQRLEDIRLLKVEIKRLRQEKMLLTKSADNVADLRQEVFHLERDLTQARLKCRALEEEIQNPLNIHRWRKLEGSDPDVFTLLQKVQLLQKRLLHQSAEAVERERQLKESQRLYLNLKQVLSQQPGPNIKEELSKTQKALTQRANKMKCLVTELNMTEQQANEYKVSLQKVTNELSALKRKYWACQKKNQALGSAPSTDKSGGRCTCTEGSVSDQGQTQYTGGGFRMK